MLEVTVEVWGIMQFYALCVTEDFSGLFTQRLTALEGKEDEHPAYTLMCCDLETRVESVFENAHFTFFSDLKNTTFYVFRKDVSKSHKKSLAKVESSILRTEFTYFAQ